MYFIQREGVYPQGIFWIGNSIDEGRRKLIELTDADVDDYHAWVLYRYVDSYDIEYGNLKNNHEEIYRSWKGA